VALADGQLAVPFSYVSGSALLDTSTYDNATLASLGVTPGAYIWTWGAGASADSLPLQIGPAPTNTPEPASLALSLAAARWCRTPRRPTSENKVLGRFGRP
jgi:hypothetical protein